MPRISLHLFVTLTLPDISDTSLPERWSLLPQGRLFSSASQLNSREIFYRVCVPFSRDHMHILHGFKTRSKVRTHLIPFRFFPLHRPTAQKLSSSFQSTAHRPSFMFCKISRLERKPRGSSLSILIRTAVEAYHDIQVFQQSSTILSDAKAVRVQVCNS
jgi:hypothetical protein